MKKEKLKKKLVLNKVSIAQLGKDQINKIKSGEKPPSSGVPTCNADKIGCGGCP
ncbi:MAG TPA: class I lanthipeptide [Candidatus Kapabacteria bacterium]|nr:class I lanthipeptide [Candidatus Kapabacteria bacterium]